MASSSESRTGVCAIVAGALIFAGQAGELVFGSPSDLVGAVFVALFGLGVAALVVAIWRLGGLVSRSKVGRIGWRICVAGVVFLGLFAVQALVAITVEDGVHDIGLFVFEGAWIGLGVALLRADRRGAQDPASALA
jgi:hypothetical protein